ncbi:RNA polymerase sigma factor [Ammoniphilus resinae]|uniref:RNA polymerase sigma-70 factor (ECF subfamily) n=1 Tax=Ammoniphilus resinae TaxID=861532 RepID=A0ABS4GT42_9BACL|nr:sigma-70 family RNA polymerase sigma factor [Ammoniphilus resinae]MBP1933428.1 RNA polymerase sigma-70 factor (ECF subfamily) [Ammoniphilus resinae]
MLTDSQLIREIKDGRVECYAELIKRYEKRILAFIVHMLNNTNLDHIAEDLCQETFYKAYRSLHSFRDVEASFSTWLYTIARNSVLSELRKSRNSEIYLEDSKVDPTATWERLPEYELLRSEREKLVRLAIENLPEKQRFAIILREYEDKDYKEIADVLNSTVSSVKSLLFRARSSIKSQLESYISDARMEEVKGMSSP